MTALFRVGALGALLLLAAPSARASGLDRARDCLDRFNLSCAEGELKRLESSNPDSKDAQRVRAWVAFHQGRYDEALTLIDRLQAQGVDVEAEEPYTPYRPTASAAQGMVETVEGGVRIRYYPGVDLVLADQAAASLRAARQTYDGIFGGGPDHDIVLDIFPTARRFIDASGLPPESVQTTNVIALSKWTRLLLTDPATVLPSQRS